MYRLDTEITEVDFEIIFITSPIFISSKYGTIYW